LWRVEAVPQTLEQLRADHAWKKCESCNSDYTNLAKGLPALIMNSGLMQVMAFLHEKGRKPSQQHCEKLGKDLRAWLHSRFQQAIPDDSFEKFMESLMRAEPRVFQNITAEAFAWLRWVRQIAPARQKAK